MSAKDEAIKRKMESTIGLSPGKASGKTPGFQPIWPGVVPEEHQNCCSYTPDLVKRIAELEAELAATRDDALNELNDMKLRAEKAEAEVERLRAAIARETADHGASVATGLPCKCFLCVALRGGGRESGADRKMKPSGDGVNPSRDVGPSGPKPGPLSTDSAAANPAARPPRCELCGGRTDPHLPEPWPDCCDCKMGPTTARKERDG